MVSKAIAPRNAKKRPFVLKEGISMLSDLADGNAIHGYPGDYPGQIYYVNNLTGSTAGDGLSWDTPFKEISEAISASEDFRTSSVAGNEYVRNIIYVQGTGTAYGRLTALPSYCDLIGIGANPRGNGGGICMIIDNTTEDAIEVGSDGVRGLYMANFQVGCTLSGDTGYAMDLAKVYRSTFENCVFWNKVTGGVRLVIAGGVTFRNCHIGGGDTSYALIGLNQTGSVNFNNCLIEDCFIFGETYGVVITAYSCNNTWFRNNYIYGGDIGLDDNSTATQYFRFAVYTDNRFLSGTTAYSAAEASGNKTTGCIGNSNGTTVFVSGHA